MGSFRRKRGQRGRQPRFCWGGGSKPHHHKLENLGSSVAPPVRSGAKPRTPRAFGVFYCQGSTCKRPAHQNFRSLVRSPEPAGFTLLQPPLANGALFIGLLIGLLVVEKKFGRDVRLLRPLLPFLFLHQRIQPLLGIGLIQNVGHAWILQFHGVV